MCNPDEDGVEEIYTLQNVNEPQASPVLSWDNEVN